MGTMTLVAQGCSERGPRTRHEDALAWDAAAGVFAVADGVGSGGGGDVAAQAAVARVVAVVGVLPGEAEAWGVAEGVMASAQLAVHEAAQSHRGGRCCTTLAVLVIRQGWAVLAWVGDSRIYRVRGGAVELLTRDHRSGRHVLDRWLGPGASEHRTKPELLSTIVQAGDAFALVTDGVGDTLSEAVLAEVLASGRQDIATAETLVRAALEAGSTDNCTALVVRVEAA